MDLFQVFQDIARVFTQKNGSELLVLWFVFGSIDTNLRRVKEDPFHTWPTDVASFSRPIYKCFKAH